MSLQTPSTPKAQTPSSPKSPVPVSTKSPTPSSPTSPGKLKVNDPSHRQYLRNKNAAFFAAVYKVNICVYKLNCYI